MPGFELFGDLERNEVNDVLQSGILMRYGFDGMRNGHWKAKELETALENTLQSKHVQLVSSGTAAVSVALAAAGVGADDEVIQAAECTEPDKNRNRLQQIDCNHRGRFGQIKTFCPKAQSDHHKRYKNRPMYQVYQAIVEVVGRALGDSANDTRNDQVGDFANDDEYCRDDGGLQVDIRSNELGELLDTVGQIVQVISCRS